MNGWGVLCASYIFRRCKLVADNLMLLRREDTHRLVTWVVDREVLNFLSQEASDTSKISAKNNIVSLSAYLEPINNHYVHHPYSGLTAT